MIKRTFIIIFLILLMSSTFGQTIGKMIDVGGYKLHISQAGIRKADEPTIILLHGLGSYSLDWYLVQEKVKSFAFVCSIDRAGQAWSEPGLKPRGPVTAAKEMNTLLTRAGIKPPYILVGHSWGGFVARTYFHLYPKNVAGIIFVSSSVEDEYLWINGKIVAPRLMSAEEWGKLTNKAMRDKDTTDPDRILYQIPRPEKLDAPFDKLPDSIQQIRIQAMVKPVTKRLSEGGDVNDFRTDFIEVHETTLNKRLPLNNLPLIVLADEIPYDPKNEDGYSKEQYDWNNNLQKKLSELSANGIEIITTKSDHYIQLSQPELVVGAIREMKNAIKFHKKISDKKIKAHLTKLAEE